MATEAKREDPALNDWQIEETKKGLAEADHSDFASDQDLQKILSKWMQRAD